MVARQSKLFVFVRKTRNLVIFSMPDFYLHLQFFGVFTNEIQVGQIAPLESELPIDFTTIIWLSQVSLGHTGDVSRERNIGTCSFFLKNAFWY